MDVPGSRVERSRNAIARFATACKSDPRVIAAFLGGSYAAGTQDEQSDIDVYLVTRERDYEAFFEDRERYLKSWGGIAWSRVRRNFEGLGWDMILFIMDDGVDGELALSHEQNFRQMHGGPYVVLVDKVGLLDGVDFPMLGFGPPSKDELQESFLDFWLEARSAIKAWSRGRLWEAAEWVGAMRKRTRGYARLVEADDREERLAGSFTSLNRDDIARAIEKVVAAYRRWGTMAAEKFDARFPHDLVRLGVRRLESALQAEPNSRTHTRPRTRRGRPRAKEATKE